LFVLDKDPVKSNVLVPAYLQTGVAGTDKPKVGLSHDLLHFMLFMNQRRHLVRDLGSSYALGIMADWTGDYGKINSSEIGSNSL
jgi:hypothetical protein